MSIIFVKVNTLDEILCWQNFTSCMLIIGGSILHTYKCTMTMVVIGYQKHLCPVDNY